MSRSITRRSAVALPLALSATASGHWGLMVSGYRLVDLGTLGGPSSRAMAVNASGTIVGYAYTRLRQQHPCLWSKGHIVDLQPPGFEFGVAADVNDHGDVVLTGGSMSHGYRSYLWSNGHRAALPSSFMPRAVDNRRRIVGTLRRHGVDVPAIWDRGTITSLTRYGITPGGPTWTATISSSGMVAGTDRIGAYLLTGLTGPNGTAAGRLRRPPAATSGSGSGSGLNFTEAWGCNARGDVVGLAMDGTRRQVPALWTSNGVVLALGSLATPPDVARETGTGANAVNSSRQVVGRSVTDAYPDGHPFLWARGRMIDLGVLSPDPGSSFANDLNDRGLVVGATADGLVGGSDDENMHAVAWVPGIA